MKVVIFGSSGMVGQGVLRECLNDDAVTEVIAVVRSPAGASHSKLREVVHKDFLDFSALDVGQVDAVFWCLGVTSAGMSEEDYTRITHDFTMAAAKKLASKAITFVFVSGTGADGNSMWARVKKKTEEDVRALPFKEVYVFRPGMIQPMHGIRSRTRMYNILYPLIWPLMMITKAIKPGFVTTTERVGRAMLRVAKEGYSKKLLENPDINAAA